MAYVAPTTRSDGYVVPASVWNSDVVANVIALKALIDGGGAVWAEQTTTATGTQNNFDLTARATYLRCTGAAPDFTGFTVAGAAPQAGDAVIIECLGTTAKVSDQTGSTAANQIVCPATQGQIVGVGGAMLLTYDGTTDRWRESLLEPGAPISYTPTWTGAGGNPSIGNGTNAGTYIQRGKQCWVQVQIVAGNTTTFGTGAWSHALPLTAIATTSTGLFSPPLQASLYDDGTNYRVGFAFTHTTTTLRSFIDSAADFTGATVPITWANLDEFRIAGWYVVA